MISVESEILETVKAMADLLIDEMREEDGAVFCSQCGIAHGRSPESIFPFAFLYRETGKQNYRDAALACGGWLVRNQMPDGSWHNEQSVKWPGITVFNLLALLGAIDLLQECVDCSPLRSASLKAARWVEGAIDRGYANINYPITAMAVLALAAQILGVPSFSHSAGRLRDDCIEIFTGEGFIHGEGNAYPSVDIGYNFDMSLGMLALFARLTDDERVLALALRSTGTHLEFLYPDGSLDNSFGTRSYKWTLFGSKTAHAMQIPLLLLADRDQRFSLAAVRNLRYLNRIRQGGFIPTGPARYDNRVCIHASFTRMTALSQALYFARRFNIDITVHEGAQLPSEQHTSRFYENINTLLYRGRDFVATVAGYGVSYWNGPLNHPSGGSLSYLYHRRTGPLQIGSVNEYIREEPFNMTEMPQRESITPRIELVSDPRCSNVYCSDSAITLKDNTVHVGGVLQRVEASFAYSIEYRFARDMLIKRYRVAGGTGMFRIIEPIFAYDDDSVERGEGIILIMQPERVVEVKCASENRLLLSEGKIWCPFPGVWAHRIVVEPRSDEVSVAITVRLKDKF